MGIITNEVFQVTAAVLFDSFISMLKWTGTSQISHTNSHIAEFEEANLSPIVL